MSRRTARANKPIEAGDPVYETPDGVEPLADGTCWQPGDDATTPPPARRLPPMATVTIAGIPLGVVPENVYLQRHVDVQLDLDSAVALRGLLQGLEETEAQLKSGRLVKSGADAVRWLLDRVYDAAHSKPAA